jgi:uncharacterized protein (DUF2336 family)
MSPDSPQSDPSGRRDGANPRSLIEELETAVSKKDVRHQAEVMRRVTDLFIEAGSGFSDEHITMFDEVMSRLVSAIESSARAMFGDRFATLPNAPPKTIRKLALDDAIKVAGPVLARSGRLDDATLVETAKTKSQDHLLAISQRQTISEAVTDVLVDRGDQQVVRSVAANAGARFSEFGCSTLSVRSKNDAELAVQVLSRSDIPRQHLLTIFAAASETVRQQLRAKDRSKAELYQYMVSQAANQIQTQAREASAKYSSAQTYVEALHQSKSLSEERLREFAGAGRFDEVTVALALMCNLPIGTIERVVVSDQVDRVLLLAKAIGLSWEVVVAILEMPAASRGCTSEELERYRLSFMRLQAHTAKAALQFYGLRVRAAAQSSR